MIIKVALQVPPSYLLDYKINDEVNLFDRVLVQVGKRELIGFVVAKEITVDYPISKVKPVIKVIDSPISQSVQKLICWIAGYYCCDLYSSIRLALPNDFFKKEEISPQKDISIVKNDQIQEVKLTSKQQAVVDVFDNESIIKYDDLKAKFSVNIISRLVDKNILTKTTELKGVALTEAIKDKIKHLNEDQQQAYEKIAKQDSFKTFLLYGVTGSGKTEVYLQAIQQVLDNEKQVLVLIPEINLTPQTLKRFESRFPAKKIATLHSKVSERTRLTNWFNIRNGNADVVISTRSGVLADFKNLGMIIVDEEHDSSFKQQSSTIRYNARDVAIYRASQLNIPVVLGSATPSIESYYNCINGKYELLKLKDKALNNFKNEVRLVDLKSSIVDNGICSKLFDELENNINAHSQSLVFINKLGFAKALVCKSCNVAVECQKCDKPYTLHTHPYQYLQCHYCGTRKPLVTGCMSCEGGELFTYGTGTEKVQSRIEAKFPYNKIIRFDRNNIKTIDDLDEINKLINENMVDVIVGTQMIAKGHHFANITLVGLINIDAGLYSTDFHAIEKTAQLIVQVSGRAGRADKPGKILLQTYQPENKLLQLLVSRDYLEFLDYLLEQREYAKYPPYTFQAQILAESRNEQIVLEFLNQLYTKLADIQKIDVSKPLPALHLKRNNTYRYSLLLTSSNRKQINNVVNWVRESILSEVANNIKVYFDIDPVELS